jgi:small nuclear ribonucleoprotein (snRNP)-like protein
MRGMISWVLILMFASPPGSAFAQGGRTFEERIRDMSAEAERFLERLPESGWLDDGSGLGTSESLEAARLRTRLRNLPSGTEIAVTLRGGERVRGDLAGANEESFDLFMQATEGPKIKRSFRYEDVESSDLPEASGWIAPEKIRMIPKGKKVEVLLVDGEKLRGRLRELTDRGFALEVERSTVREYPYEQLASLRTAGGLETHHKVLIAVGVAAVVLVLVYLAALEEYGG